MLFNRIRLPLVLIIALLSFLLAPGQATPTNAATYFYHWNSVFPNPDSFCENTITHNHIEGSFSINTLNTYPGSSYTMVPTLNGIPKANWGGSYGITGQSGTGNYEWGYALGSATAFPYNFSWVFTLKSPQGKMLSRATISYTCTASGMTNIQISNIDFTDSKLALAFDDGRCNQDAGQTVTVYPDKKGGYFFYAIHEGVGYYAMQVTKSQLEDNPDNGTNYLIAEKVGVRLYRLAGGQLQVNRIAPDGKEYVFIWSACG